ncbi:MAG: hypothetical protein ACE5H3_02615 [Planctomycetota bacterium]
MASPYALALGFDAKAEFFRTRHPEFARKYGISCSTCHLAVPRLNDFGRRFRANGFQMPGTIESTPVWGQKTPPIGLMIHEMGLGRRVQNRMGVKSATGIPPRRSLSLTGFRNLSLEFFSGGIVAENLSYLVVGEFENELEVEGGTVRTNLSTALEQVFFEYNNLDGGKTGNANFRVGQFELEIPFSQMRSFSSDLSDFLIYSVAPRQESARLNSPQVGVSLFGRVEDCFGGLWDQPCAFEWEFAAVNGTNDNFNSNHSLDYFIRGGLNFYEIGSGIEILRVGGLGYIGKEDIGESSIQGMNSSAKRYGADVSVQFLGGWTAFAQWLRGGNDDTDPINKGNQEFNFHGGFAGLEAPITAQRDLWFYSRFDYVKAGDQWSLTPLVVNATGNVDRIKRITLGTKFYFSPNSWMQLELAKQDNMLGYPGPANGGGRILNVDNKWIMLMFVATF